MTDAEFDLLDELYFVQPFSYLRQTLGWPDGLILETLQSLYQKAYIKCLNGPDEEVFDLVDLMEKGTEMFFLASKKGLMEHNAL